MAETILSAFKSTPLPNSAIIPLDFDKTYTDLPSSHAWPSSDVENYPLDQLVESSIYVPIIDISNPNPKQLDELKHACEKWGFFKIINHGVSEVLLDDFKTEAARLFALPMEVKLRALRSPHDSSGYGGAAVIKFSPNKTWHEGFGIKDSTVLHQHALKIWPSNGNPKFCQVMKEYQQALQALAERVLTLVFASVGLRPNDANWAEPKTKGSPFSPCETHLLLNSYPLCPDPANAMGLNQHSDTSIITLVNQINNISGLQTLHEGKWVNVQPTPGSFVVNCGDLAHILFNGRFVSPVHRVVPSLAEHRYSAAYMYGPPRGAPLAPLTKLVGPDSKPVYRQVMWDDYLKAKYELFVAEKVFDLIRNDKVEENKEALATN